MYRIDQAASGRTEDKISGSAGEADTAQKRYLHFQKSGQEKLRLKDALDGYTDSSTPDRYREEYRKYLVRRIRPACAELIQEGKTETVLHFLEEGMLREDALKELLKNMQDPDQPVCWLRLLHLCRKWDERKASDSVVPGAIAEASDSVVPGAIAEASDSAVPGANPEASDPHQSEYVYRGTDFCRSGQTLKRKASDWTEHSDEASVMLGQCRKDLYALFPALDGAVFALTLKEVPSSQNQPVTGSAAADGEMLWYDSGWLIEKWKNNPAQVRRGYLHILLHCLFFHIWDMDGSDALQNLAADIFVEFCLEQECWKDRNLRQWLGYLSSPGIWSELYDSMNGQIQSPERIRRWLEKTGADTEKWQQIFSFDDHTLWKKNRLAQGVRKKGIRDHSEGNAEPSGQGSGTSRRKWELLAAQSAGAGQGGRGCMGIGSESGSDSQSLKVAGRSITDYRSFLQQFAVEREEMELDPESFDYIYYSLGMKWYDGMPMIEPLEYREGHKLEELVIAIDTSGSCKTETVRGFLQEACSILEEKENFFRKMNVWIIQCDCVIQNVSHIRSRMDWDEYIRNLKIQGRAGTDFRPVFRYVEKLRENKELKELKGLIYFTDGDGAYPREAPDYRTAFAFLKPVPAISQVPRWAQVLITEQYREVII